jgi:hypothetical protein
MKVGEVVRDTTFRGGHETYLRVFKVPRQCPFVLLVKEMHIIGINFYMTLEGLHYSEI